MFVYPFIINSSYREALLSFLGNGSERSPYMNFATHESLEFYSKPFF